MQDTTFIWVSYTHKVTFLDPSHSKKLFNYFVLRCHFVSLIQFSPFLPCILGNERMEVMKGAHLLISCTHICHFFPLLYGTVLKARQKQNIVNSKVIAVFFQSIVTLLATTITCYNNHKKEEGNWKEQRENLTPSNLEQVAKNVEK